MDFIISKNLDRFPNQSKEIFIYQSKDDTVVPFSNCISYQDALPSAHIRIFEDRQHFNQDNFPEIVEDIKNLV